MRKNTKNGAGNKWVIRIKTRKNQKNGKKQQKCGKTGGPIKGRGRKSAKKHRVYISAKHPQKASKSEVKLQRSGLKKGWVTRPSDGRGKGE